jgi:hypothetical protein
MENEKKINVGTLVQYIAAGALNVSKVRNMSIDGLYAHIDCYEGREMIFYREKRVPVSKVTFIAEGTVPSFTLKMIHAFLNKID